MHLLFSYVTRMCRRPGNNRSVGLTRLKAVYNRHRRCPSLQNALLDYPEEHESTDVAGLLFAFSNLF